MKQDKTITALLGAGAVIDIGGPSTDQLTDLVMQKTQTLRSLDGKDCPVNFLNRVAERLTQYFDPYDINFEDIYHALEQLSSFERGWETGTAKPFKPHAGAFLSPRDLLWFKNPDNLLGQAKDDLIRVVGNRIATYVNDFDPKVKHLWFSEFWQQALSLVKWDIGTLNYDDCIEKGLTDIRMVDGFEDTNDGFERFDPQKILRTKNHRMMHLHGSIRYGYPERALLKVKDINRYTMTDVSGDLYKFKSYEEAKGTWFGRSRVNSQDGEETHAGPIVTGLRKADKTLVYPYSLYQAIFHQSLIENSRFLIAGYSCGDYHINNLLDRIGGLHGNNRRIVIISYFPSSDPENEWSPEIDIMDWMSEDMKGLIRLAFRDRHPFKTHEFFNPVISRDRRTRLYLKGMKDAIKNHGQDILDFLTS